MRDASKSPHMLPRIDPCSILAVLERQVFDCCEFQDQKVRCEILIGISKACPAASSRRYRLCTATTSPSLWASCRISAPHRRNPKTRRTSGAFSNTRAANSFSSASNACSNSSASRRKPFHTLRQLGSSSGSTNNECSASDASIAVGSILPSNNTWVRTASVKMLS